MLPGHIVKQGQLAEYSTIVVSVNVLLIDNHFIDPAVSKTKIMLFNNFEKINTIYKTRKK